MYNNQNNALAEQKTFMLPAAIPEGEFTQEELATRNCTMHYIRVSVVEKLILEAIREVSAYALSNEKEFVKKVREASDVQQETTMKEYRRRLGKTKRRHEELDDLVKKLYESFATGKIPEKHFDRLLSGYDNEPWT